MESPPFKVFTFSETCTISIDRPVISITTRQGNDIYQFAFMSGPGVYVPLSNGSLAKLVSSLR